MRFQFTMNMPSRGRDIREPDTRRDTDMRGNPPVSGQNLVHQIYADHPAESLDALLQAIASADFLVVEELYRQADRSTKSVGLIALNPLFIGKIKAIG